VSALESLAAADLLVVDRAARDVAQRTRALLIDALAVLGGADAVLAQDGAI
jgi:hypothetical protein